MPDTTEQTPPEDEMQNNTTTRRNYTRELLALAGSGWVVVGSVLPADGLPVTHSPRSTSDPQPWAYTDRHGCEWRFSGRECHTLPACGTRFLGGKRCGLPTGHDRACQPRT